MKNFLFIAALFTGIALFAAEPLVKIPQITAEKAAELASAEIFWEGDWEGAAVIRTFTNTPYSLGPISEPTAFYLFHDGENLWAASYCAEKDFSAARAFPRGPMDDLTFDEAVQIVIGFDGKVNIQLNMGGYEGAFNNLGKCAHLYEMTVNMAGAATRSYDETPLRDPKFDYAVVPAEGGWAVLWRIPFASVGYDFTKGGGLYFNMFRFYRGERYGWHLPSFGGYSQLPMGKALLLDAADNAMATVETDYKTGSLAIDSALPARGRLDMEYYAAAGEVGAEVPSGSEGAEITLTVNGKSISAAGSNHWPTRLKLPVECAEGENFTAVLIRDGKELLRKEYTAKATAPWRSGVAEEYLEDRVPYPWTNPEFADGTLTLSHGVVEFGDGMFPVSISNCRNQEILAAPITLEAEVDGQLLPVNARASYSKTATAIEMISESLPGLEVKTRTEFDGFMTVRARVTGLERNIPDTLRLRIPLAEGLAQYVNNGSSQQLIKSGGFGYCGNYREALWVGDRNGGIVITNSHPVFYSPKNGRQIVVNGDELVITLVSEDGIIPPEDNVFEFHFMFTPFRSDNIPPMDCKFWFESWSDYQAYPDLKKLPQVAERVADAQSQGKDFFLYFGQVVAENAPEFVEYPTDFTSYPRRPWYQRAYEPGLNVPCSVVCFRGEVGDFMLDKIDILAGEAGLPGVYLDGPSVPFECGNLNHNCSSYLPAQWDGSWHEGNITGQRSYMKRLRGIFDSRGSKRPIWHHTGGGFNMATFSMCDFYWDGEQLSRYRRGYLLPPETFSIIYSGYPFGFQGVFLPIFYTDSTLTVRQSNAWVAPHGVINAISGHSYFEAYLQICKRAPETVFYPYTGEQPHIKNLNSNTLCTSYYLANNEAVLISSNIVYDGMQEAVVDVSGLFPGEELQIRCLNREEIPDFENGILRIPVSVRDLKIYHIAPVSTDVSAFDLPDPWRAMADTAPAVPLQAGSGFDISKWQVESGECAPVAGTGLEAGLKSTGGKAVIRYKESLPDNVAFKFKFRHSGKFMFYVDGVEISFDYHSAKGWLIEKLDIYDNLDRCDVSVAAHGRSYSVLDREVELEVYIIDGRVAFFYDGVRILQYGLPAKNHENGHTLAIETKDNAWIAFDLEYSGPATEADMPFWIHPVM